MSKKVNITVLKILGIIKILSGTFYFSYEMLLWIIASQSAEKWYSSLYLAFYKITINILKHIIMILSGVLTLFTRKKANFKFLAILISVIHCIYTYIFLFNNLISYDCFTLIVECLSIIACFRKQT